MANDKALVDKNLNPTLIGENKDVPEEIKRIKVDPVTGGIVSTPSTPGTIGNGQKVVTTAATAEALASTTTIKGVIIKALATNTQNVYVGDSGVTAANGFVLAAGETVAIDVADPATVFLDVDIDGEGVSFLTVN